MSVQIFAADGRAVKVFPVTSFSAGDHTVSWKIDGSMKSGMYLYRVTADDLQSRGRVLTIL